MFLRPLRRLVLIMLAISSIFIISELMFTLHNKRSWSLIEEEDTGGNTRLHQHQTLNSNHRQSQLRLNLSKKLLRYFDREKTKLIGSKLSNISINLNTHQVLVQKYASRKNEKDNEDISESEILYNGIDKNVNEVNNNTVIDLLLGESFENNSSREKYAVKNNQKPNDILGKAASKVSQKYYPSLSPYTPFNKYFHTKNATLSAEQKADHIRSGLNIEVLSSEVGHSVLKENGVIYRETIEENPTGGFVSRFHPEIPFDEELFFERDEIKIRSFHKLKAASTSGGIHSSERKVILWWKDKWFSQPIRGLQPLSACPDLPCLMTSERSYANVSAAFIMNGEFSSCMKSD